MQIKFLENAHSSKTKSENKNTKKHKDKPTNKNSN